jgi:hypothetical protein
LQDLTPSVYVPFKTIAIGEESGVRSQEELVISDQEQWEALWQQHMSYSRTPLSLPQVDFTEEMVIAVFGGIESEGYMLRITRIERGAEISSLTLKSSSGLEYNSSQHRKEAGEWFFSFPE